jgi:penicillin-binding protein 2
MFHRRLVLLYGICLLIIFVLGAQLLRLAVVHGEQMRLDAEKRLDSRKFLATYRGPIFDRKGREIALDRPCYDVAVEYEVITRAWELKRALKQAREEAGAHAWDTMKPEQRDAAAKTVLPQWRAKTEALWQSICILGNIPREELDRRLNAIKQEVQTTAAEVWDRQQLADELRFGQSGGSNFKRRPIREQEQAHVVLSRVSDEVAFKFNELARQWPEMLEVQDSTRREYPWSEADVTLDRSRLPGELKSDEPTTIRVVGVADHILGAMRDEIYAEDVQRRPFLDPKTKELVDLGGYRTIGDTAGGRGPELVFEDHLRGRRGVIHRRVDTGEETRTDFTPGKALNTTLDIVLQARVQAILSHELGLTVVQPWHENTLLPEGTRLNSAAVVLEVATGEILAMVSMPTMAMGAAMTQAERERDNPWVNRPAEAIYPPGSIVKPLVLSAAVREGVFGLDDGIECTGHYFPDKLEVARCWIYRPQYGMTTHTAQIGGAVDAEAALSRSCNIFFYSLADRLRIERLCQWYSRFGLGQVLDAGLYHSIKTSEGKTIWTGEAAGNLPDAAQIEKIRKGDERRFQTIIMGIGQGQVTWTPLQAANAYATLARGGAVRDATLVMDDSLRTQGHRRAAQDLKLPPRLVAKTLEGLRQSVEETWGTGHRIKALGENVITAPDVTVWAKTGTAQAPLIDVGQFTNQETDEDDQGHASRLDYSWFVGLVGPKQKGGQAPQPKYAVAVLVEYGGSGGRVAGPIANQIILSLQAEGYLPGGKSESSGSGGGS